MKQTAAASYFRIIDNGQSINSLSHTHTALNSYIHISAEEKKHKMKRKKRESNIFESSVASEVQALQLGLAETNRPSTSATHQMEKPRLFIVLFYENQIYLDIFHFFNQC